MLILIVRRSSKIKMSKILFGAKILFLKPHIIFIAFHVNQTRQFHSSGLGGVRKNDLGADRREGEGAAEVRRGQIQAQDGERSGKTSQGKI